jgi:hypothetical protein
MESVLFGERPPDVILTHEFWTILAGLERSERVRADYTKVTIDGVFMLLRNDRLERLRQSPPPGVTAREVDALPEVERARLRGAGSDKTDVPNPWRADITLPRGGAPLR